MTSLPDRLRAAAAFIEAHNLPYHGVSFASPPYNHVNVTAESIEEVEAWASALGVDVGRNDYPAAEDGPWTAYSAEQDHTHRDDLIRFFVQFSDQSARVPA